MSLTIKKIGKWNTARLAVNGMAMRAALAQEKATKQEAQLFRSLVLRAFNSGGKTNGIAWPKLSPITIAKKGSTKILIETAQMKKSVLVHKVSSDTFFVGISSKVQRPEGGPLVNIAAVHEYGKVIAKRGGLVTIPKRSFLQSTADFHFKPDDVANRYAARIAIMLGTGWKGTVPKASALAKAGKAAV